MKKQKTNVEKIKDINKKRRKPKKIKRNEIRKNHSKEGHGHPAYIFAEIGDSYEYNGLTHSNITQGIKNIELEQNPNPKDKEKAYVRPKKATLNKSKFSQFVYEDWKMSKKDKKKIRRLNNKKWNKKRDGHSKLNSLLNHLFTYIIQNYNKYVNHFRKKT